MATRRAAKKKRVAKLKRRRYVIRKVDPIAYGDDIAQMMASGFQNEAGTRPTTFIGMSWWIAFEMVDGAELIAGCASMCHSAIEEGSFYLARAYVLPDHRGEGLQRKLIKARVDRAIELKGTHVTSDTYDNPPSTNNLIASGFRCYRPVSPWRGEGTNYWKLVL